MAQYGKRTRNSQLVSSWGRPSPTDMYAVYDTSTANVTASASAHTKGSWTQIIASTSIEAGWLIYNYSNFANGVASTGLLDIGIGAAGSETVLVANVPCGYGRDAAPLTIPINLPAGTRISARTQSAIGSRVTTCKIGLMKDNHGMNVTTVDTYNADTATSSFTTALTVAYSEIVTSTAYQYRALGLHVAHRTDTAIASSTDTRVRIATGAAGAEVDVATLSRNANSSEYFTFGPVGTSPIGYYVGNVPVGTRLSVASDVASSTSGGLIFGVR